jgi:hypothetical protein
MLVTIVSLLLAQTPSGPIKHPGLTPNFHEICRNVESKLEVGDFEAATKAWLALPSRQLKLEWNEASIPANRRSEFESARDQVIADLTEGLPELKIELKKPGDIKISFAPNLPVKNLMPQGAVLFFSPTASEPRVESVISLQRGNPANPVEQIDVYNEIGHAVLAYFGRLPTPVSGDLGFRTDLPSRERRRISGADRSFYKKSMMVVDSLKKSIDTKTRIRPEVAKAQFDISAFELGNHVQGEIIPISFQITNTGSGLLMVQARPDCGCLFIDPALNIEPGRTALVKGGVDTHEYVGNLAKKYFITTNDPDHASFEVPVLLSVAPLFRTLMPVGNTILATKNGAEADIFLTLNPAAKFKAISVSTAGLPSTASIVPWNGTLPDPEFGEAAIPRSGYKVHIRVEKGMPKGRFGLTALIATDSLEFPVIRHSFNVQTGIVSLPDQVYFGEIDRSPRRGFFFLSRPNKPFRILSIATNSPFAIAKIMTAKGQTEYRISVILDGTQPTGRLGAKVKIKTDDPEQPNIEVPVTGSVK